MTRSVLIFHLTYNFQPKVLILDPPVESADVALPMFWTLLCLVLVMYQMASSGHNKGTAVRPPWIFLELKEADNILWKGHLLKGGAACANPVAGPQPQFGLLACHY